MTEPTRVRCENLDFDNLLRYATQNVTRAKHLVFEIEPQLLPNGKQGQHEIIESLALALPHCHIFDAGARLGLEHITVLQVISEREIIAHEDEIVLAAQSFRQLANKLMQRQSDKLNVAFGEINHHFRFISQRGKLNWNWTYCLHGFQCLFKSKFGQVVDVHLRYAPEYGVLDAWFFFNFINSTRQFRHLSQLFLSPYHDMTRTLNVLHRRGLLLYSQSEQDKGLIAKGKAL